VIEVLQVFTTTPGARKRQVSDLTRLDRAEVADAGGVEILIDSRRPRARFWFCGTAK
jgi:hypothetical protein